MGLLDFLSPALTVATNAAGTYENAQANAAQQRQQQIIQNLMMQRQQQQQELHNNLVRSQTGEANARIGDIAAQQKIRENQALHPKPNYAPPVIGPNGEVQLVNYDDPTHPTRVPGIQGKVERQPQEAKDQLVQVTGADGKLHYVWANPQSHTTTPANIDPRQPIKKDQNPSDVKIFSASSLPGMEKAHGDLTKFGTTVSANGPLANFFVGHNPLDNTLQQANQAADSWVSFATPIQYRGRTTKIEADLVRKSQVPVVGDNPATIAAKQAAREEVMRKARIMATNQATADPAGTPSATPKLSPEDAARAQQDPDFAAWLKQQGHLP